MSDFREEMPPSERKKTPNVQAGTILRPSGLSVQARRLKRRALRAIGLDELHARVPVGQTAELRMIPTRDGTGMEPLVFDCPVCSERDGVPTKLLMMKLETRPGSCKRGWFHRGPSRQARMLLRIDRDQLERIRADFTASELARIQKKFGRDRSDREMVVDSLVP